MPEKKLFLIDGHALTYRSHYAFINRPLINSKGLNTSAITGFIRTVWDMITNQKPTHLAVAFDPSGPTFRHEWYEPYKANRDAQPEDITKALPYIRSIIEAFNIPIICIDNYEADDVIGTLAKQAEKEGFDVYMITPDKDFAQLVSEHIYMYKPSRQGNGIDILGIKEVLEQWEISNVDQVKDILGLQGDSVDNIPGIPGIGAKTAVKLLQEYGSVEGLIDNVEQLKGKQKENVQNFAEQGLLSKKLATINTEVPIQFDAKKYEVEGFDRVRLKEIFADLEFRSLAQSILGEASQGEQGTLFAPVVQEDLQQSKTDIGSYQIANSTIETKDHHYQLVQTESEIAALIVKMKKEKVICFDTETTGLDSHEVDVVGVSFAWTKGEGYYIPISEDRNVALKTLHPLKEILEDNSIIKVGQNIKYDINILRRYDIGVVGPYFDTMIAHYLLEPDLRHKLDYLSESYLSYKMVPIEQLIGKKGPNQKSMRTVELEELCDYAVEDADITMQLKDQFEPKLKEEQLLDLFENIEMPLIQVLSNIESEGVRVDKKFLNEYSKELLGLILNKRAEIYEKAGMEFNIASPKQVGEVLFESMKIPYRWRKTSSGQYSTDVDKLTEMALEYDIVDDILEYRKFTKLKSTYVDALPLMISKRTGRIHSSFNQARAATGRLSSENPNLQNIPIKNEAGREIRKAFIPRDNNYVLLAADYSQIELRLIAEISNEENMLSAFRQGLDIHRATAAGVYNVDIAEVTADQRRNAKTVNFSIIYGAGSTNLSRQLGIKRTEAKELIDNYFSKYTGLKQYMDETVEFARKNGYVTTLIGRKRYLRDINSRNSLARSNAERMAINTPIQGTAADMIKIAMINIDKELHKNNYKSKMIMQVHDELVFDVYQPELEIVQAMVIDKMKTAMPSLKVPILVESGMGNNWLEAH